jgi:DNA uptake protein ComE-like DNA-binding protein
MDGSYFNTSKGEQTALILLLSGIIALKSLCFDYWHLQHPRVQKRLAMDSVRYELQTYALQYRADGRYGISGSSESFPEKLPETVLSLREFDPNTADSVQLQALGISSFVLGNILKYREKGGVFRQKSDLAKIYGLNQDTYKKLKPYILLPDVEQASPEAEQTPPAAEQVSQGPERVSPATEQTPRESVTFEQTKTWSEGAKYRLEEAKYRLPESEKIIHQQTEIELTAPVANKALSAGDKKAYRPEAFSKVCRINTADTADLMQYPGIGRYTANRILDYRNRLGGYCSPNQLDEISGIYPENLRMLKQCLETDSSEIRKLKLNHSSLEQLRLHPYLNFYQARALIELRQARGKICSPEDLLFLEEFNEQDLNRLLPYLDCR